MKHNEIYVDYDGMGTCISATFKKGNKSLFVLYSSSAEQNKITSEVIALVTEHLSKTTGKRTKGKS